MRRSVVLLALGLLTLRVCAEGLSPARLGIIFNENDPASRRVAQYYAERRGIAPANMIGLTVPRRAVIDRGELAELRNQMLARLPPAVQSLLLVWSNPFAVECMSVTTAFAAGYRPAFCEPGCGRTASNPLYDTQGWLPADTVGWLPAMLLPSDDEALARAITDRGMQSDGSQPRGTAYLVRTQDSARSVRAMGYADTEAIVRNRIQLRQLVTPISEPVADAIAYFTGTTRVAEIAQIHFRPGAAADHLTSAGGVLTGSSQMSALDWLKHGATGSYGTVSEPCNHAGKFPNPAAFLDHYLRGDTLLEAYWKSVAMPGQGLFIGEPLARPFANHD
jgi:uncharacterized protein (TIGR03790 family)